MTKEGKGEKEGRGEGATGWVDGNPLHKFSSFHSLVPRGKEGEITHGFVWVGTTDDNQENLIRGGACRVIIRDVL